MVEPVDTLGSSLLWALRGGVRGLTFWGSISGFPGPMVSGWAWPKGSIDRKSEGERRGRWRSTISPVPVWGGSPETGHTLWERSPLLLGGPLHIVLSQALLLSRLLYLFLQVSDSFLLLPAPGAPYLASLYPVSIFVNNPYIDPPNVNQFECALCFLLGSWWMQDTIQTVAGWGMSGRLRIRDHYFEKDHRKVQII